MYNEKRLENSLQALKKGKMNHFDIVYEETYRMIYYTIYQIIKDKARSEDIMQDVFMKMLEKIDSYQQNTSPRAWLVTIARNMALNEFNKQKREVLVDVESIDLIQDESMNKDTPLIDLAMKTLNEEEFLIVMLCVGENKTRREVAEITNLSISGVTWKLDQALTKLRKKVKEDEYV
ncbi:MAG: sigma-70 family RNA polymerase sigma factor [Bacilli bacterium]|jgi:RNA polymerase sigma-70 factor (ECF subfamily)|nr:sigma-70 family RNA polymerase sigma factor [Bacilli bacterium]MDY0063749.1 sigma-70 family RNA polymerase sigma factor [Bacilli bacterium]